MDSGARGVAEKSLSETGAAGLRGEDGGAGATRSVGCRSRGEGDAQLVGAVRVLVVLGDALADFGGGDADDGVGGGVVAGVAAEDLDAEGSFLELVAAALKLLLDDEAEEAGKPFAVGEVGVVEEAIQLSQDVCLLRIAVNGCRNAPIVGHKYSVRRGLYRLEQGLCRGRKTANFPNELPILIRIRVCTLPQGPRQCRR